MSGQNSGSVRIAIKGRILTAPIGTAAPADVTAAWPAGWNDHGFTTQDGVLITPKIVEYSVKAWQADVPIRTRIVERGREIGFKLIQGGGLNSILFNGGGSWAALGAVASIGATTFTAVTATDPGAAYVVNAYAGKTLYAGTSFGTVVSNTATVLTITAWTGGTPIAGTPFVIGGSGVYQYTPPTPGVDDTRMLGIEWNDNLITKRDVYPQAIVNAVAGASLKSNEELRYDVTFAILGDTWFTLSNDPADNPAALVA